MFQISRRKNKMLQDLRYMTGETTFMRYTIKFKSVYKKNKILNS